MTDPPVPGDPRKYLDSLDAKLSLEGGLHNAADVKMFADAMAAGPSLAVRCAQCEILLHTDAQDCLNRLGSLLRFSSLLSSWIPLSTPPPLLPPARARSCRIDSLDTNGPNHQAPNKAYIASHFGASYRAAALHQPHDLKNAWYWHTPPQMILRCTISPEVFGDGLYEAK